MLPAPPVKHSAIRIVIAEDQAVVRRGGRVLVLTTLKDDETVFEAVRAGAQAYLLKDASEHELLETIRALRRGESRLTPQIACKVMDQFRRQEAMERKARMSAAPLTDKEEKILQLICAGMMNGQISSVLSLAEVTVKNHVSRIVEKLHANTRIEGPPCPSSK